MVKYLDGLDNLISEQHDKPFLLVLVYVFGCTILGLIPANFLFHFVIPGYPLFTIFGFSLSKIGFSVSPILLILGYLLVESSGFFLVRKLEEWTN